MKGICDRISIAYRTCKNNIKTTFDKAGLNKKERLAFLFIVLVYFIGWASGLVLLVGERLIWHLADVCVITQVLCAIVLLCLSAKFLYWSAEHIVTSARKRQGWKVNYGYHDFAKMEKEIAELRIQNAEFHRQLDLACEQIADLETLIRSEKK